MFKYLVMYISKDRRNISYCPLHEELWDMFNITNISGDRFYFLWEILNVEDDPLGVVEETFHFAVLYLRYDRFFGWIIFNSLFDKNLTSSTT
jgi:hypothetical protein